MTYDVTVIPGDGIGGEVVPSTVRVLEAIDVDFSFTDVDAGDAVKAETGAALPDETLEAAKTADATLFGSAGDTAAEVVLALRAELGTYVNVRPARAAPGVDALHPDTDLVILRENTEGVYGGHEATLTEDVTTLTRVVTEQASRRLAEYACDYVETADVDGFTVAHKANVMQTTDGLFLDTVRSVAEERGVETDTVLMDALAMHLVMTPGDYDVIVCPNLAGDMLSDLAAGLVGGLGLLPSANIGPDTGMFEPVHGTAPDIAGQGVANPIATILSGAMMLDYLGEPTEAASVRVAVAETLERGPHTPDLGGAAGTDDVTDAIIDRL